MSRDIASLVIGAFIGSFVVAVVVNLHLGLLLAGGTAVIIAGVTTPTVVLFLAALDRYTGAGS